MHARMQACIQARTHSSDAANALAKIQYQSMHSIAHTTLLAYKPCVPLVTSSAYAARAAPHFTV